METYFLFTAIYFMVLSCVRCNDKVTVTGYEGGSVIFVCPSRKRYDAYPKYLLRGNISNGVEVIRSDGYAEWTHSGRVSLQDKKDRNIILVTIHNLTLEDTGQYVCGAYRQGPDFYTRVKLTVLNCVTCEGMGLRGYKGGDVAINCPSKVDYQSYPKFLEKGEYQAWKKLIWSNGQSEWTHKGRFSLQDKKDRNIFTVTIHNLTLEDAGIYWCGVNTRGLDVHTKVNIGVAPPLDSKVEGVTAGETITLSDPKSPSSNQPLYLLFMFVVAMAVLVFIILLVVVALRMMMHINTRKRANRSPRTQSTVRQSTSEETAEYENDPQFPNIQNSINIYHSLNVNATQPDAIYLDLNPNTIQAVTVYPGNGKLGCSELRPF